MAEASKKRSKSLAAVKKKSFEVRRRLRSKRPDPDDVIRPAADIVPPQSVAGRALTFVVAIMSFLACLTLGAVTIVWSAADDWSNDIVREVTIQIRPVDGVDMLVEIDKAVALAQEFPGVGNVRAMSDEETRALLQPWLGTGFNIDTLPVPRIVNVEVADPSQLDLNKLRATVVALVRGGTLDDHSIWTSRLASMANAVVIVGIGILVLVLTSMVLSVVFATRSAMDGNRDVVSVLHFVGAEERFIALEFQRHFMALGLKGGIVGGVAAILVFLVMDQIANRSAGDAGSDQMEALFGGASMGIAGYAGVVGIVFLVAILTAATSRVAVHAQLRKVE